MQSTQTYTGSGPSGYFLPGDLRAAYYGNGPLTGSGQVFGVFLLDGYAIADTVSTFHGAASSTAFGNDNLLTYRPTPGGPTYTIPIISVLLDGVISNPSGIFCSPTECNDIDESTNMAEMIGMAPGISQVRQYIGKWSEDVFNAIASENLAKQINCSYDIVISPAVASLFQELAAQGQNIFVSSGDEGAYPLNPGDYWSSKPWITSVGANQVFTNGAGGTWSSEIAWPASGGGIAAPNELSPAGRLAWRMPRMGDRQLCAILRTSPRKALPATLVPSESARVGAEPACPRRAGQALWHWSISRLWPLADRPWDL